MKLWDAPKKLFAAKTPKDGDILQHIGKTIVIPTFATLEGQKIKVSEERVKIETICMNKFQQQFFEINGTHLIGALRFFCQVGNVKDVTEDQMRAFEEMELSAERLPDTSRKLEIQ